MNDPQSEWEEDVKANPALFTLGLATVVVTLVSTAFLASIASDHDDGEIDYKGRSLNLTDLYVFREDNQDPTTGSSSNLVLIMNTNPRSLARQQYYFSTNARYEFHITRVYSRDETPSGSDDVVLRFEFATPNQNNQQAITLTALKDNREFRAISATNGSAILTTNLAGSTGDSNLVINTVNLNGSPVTVFAGLREDPFFFDVEAFFRVRAFLRGEGPTASFRPASEAVDFTAGYNVNSIVVKVPIAFLRSNGGNENIFDVWETISLLQ